MMSALPLITQNSCRYLIFLLICLDVVSVQVGSGTGGIISGHGRLNTGNISNGRKSDPRFVNNYDEWRQYTQQKAGVASDLANHQPNRIQGEAFGEGEEPQAPSGWWRYLPKVSRRLVIIVLIQ